MMHGTLAGPADVMRPATPAQRGPGTRRPRLSATWNAVRMPDQPLQQPAVPSEEPARSVAVIDLDGVLADVRHRLHHLDRAPKNWDGFFAAASADPPLPEGFAVVRELAGRYEIIYLSGRPERLRATTTRWLRDQDAPMGELVLRRDGDRRPARQVKLGELRKIGRSFQIAVFVDDDPAVCATATDAGFPVFRATWVGRDGESDAPAQVLFDGAEHGET